MNGLNEQLKRKRGRRKVGSTLLSFISRDFHIIILYNVSWISFVASRNSFSNGGKAYNNNNNNNPDS